MRLAHYRNGIIAVSIFTLTVSIVAASRSSTPVATFLAVIAAAFVGTMLAVATQHFVR
jgi:hypothetical protein